MLGIRLRSAFERYRSTILRGCGVLIFLMAIFVSWKRYSAGFDNSSMTDKPGDVPETEIRTASRPSITEATAETALDEQILTYERRVISRKAVRQKLGKNSHNPIEYEMQEPEENFSSKRYTAKQIADALLRELLQKIGDGMGPIIIGGIGDSGTRGVRDVLAHFGAELLDDDKYIHAISKDSRIFMNEYPTVTTAGNIWMRSPHNIYRKPISKLHSLKYNESLLPFDFWHTSRMYAAKMLNLSMTLSRRIRPSGNALDPWGFKHPRASLLLPLWEASLRDKFIFVHVIRDGKEVALGDNQKLYDYACPKYYERNCTDDPRERVEFWADFNREIFEFVLESGMKAHQYVAIRTEGKLRIQNDGYGLTTIEDLILANAPCIQRLGHFLNFPLKAANISFISEIIQGNAGHDTSYFGYQLGSVVRGQVERAMMNRSISVQDFGFWGYHPDRFGLSLDCESLPWMNIIRKRKGRLPGDDKILVGNFSDAPADVRLRQENQKPSLITVSMAGRLKP